MFDEQFCAPTEDLQAQNTNTSSSSTIMPQAHYASDSSFIHAHGAHRILEQASWLLDSGTTNHVTSQLGNMTLQQEYKSKGKLE